MLINEKIKAFEVELIGIHGEDLGIVKTSEALALAKRLKVDLVCTSLMSSPPTCRLISAGAAKQQAQKRNTKREPKIKEIRLSSNIDEHDYETKKKQAERILTAGDSVSLVVRLQGKQQVSKAREMLDSLLQDLIAVGRKRTGIQVSGKQAAVQVDPFPGTPVLEG